MSTISKDTPLAEITLRRYEKPRGITGRELVRKICLSLGVLQPGDSRDVIVDVLDVMLTESKKKNMLSSEEIEQKVIESRKKHHLSLNGTTSPNIRRQVRRLRDIFIVEKIKNQYRITEFSSLKDILEEKILKYYLASISERVYEYCDVIDAQE